MSFSMEAEKEKKLSFLDVEIIRKQGKCTTRIYRKAIKHDLIMGRDILETCSQFR